MKFSKFHAELTEAKKFKKGDSVKIKDVKKYDALAKDDEGTVIGMMGSKVMVKVGTGQMNVDPKDLILENLAEAKEHAAYKDLMDLAKKMNNRDTRAIQVLAGKISNFTSTGNRGLMKDMAKALKSLDTDSQAEVMKILNKKDPSLGKSIVFKMSALKESEELTEDSLFEARRDAPKGDRNTTAENPLIVVYDDEFTKGKPSMSGMMNLQTWMSIHGISKKFQDELATTVLKAGAGKQTEVSKKILKDTHDEYKEEGLRPKRYWIELSKHHAKEVK